MARRRFKGALLALVNLVGGVALVGALVAPDPDTAPPRMVTVLPTAHDHRLQVAGWNDPVDVVGLGDSVMAGTNCNCAGPVTEYADALSARLGVTVHADNLGVNGATTQTLLADLEGNAQVRASVAGARVVLVIIGANDLYPQLNQYRTSSCLDSCFEPAVKAMGARLAHILGLIEQLRAGHQTTLLVANYWNVFTDGQIARSTVGQKELDWSQDITQAANRQIYLSTLAQHATMVDTVVPIKGQGDPTPLLADDGDHPNAAGVQALTAAFLSATP